MSKLINLTIQTNTTDLKAKKKNLFTVPFTFMGIRPELNKRKVYPKLEELATSIKYSGVQETLMGYVEKNPAKIALLEGHFAKDAKEVWVIVRGHRRYRAMEILYNATGANTEARFIKERQGYTDKDRVLDMITSNSGEPFTMLEQAEVYKDLIYTYNMNQSEVAKKVGKSAMAISNLVKLLGATEDTLKRVAWGQISATNVVEALQKESSLEVAKRVEAACQKQFEAGKTTYKITKKHLKTAFDEAEDKDIVKKLKLDVASLQWVIDDVKNRSAMVVRYNQETAQIIADTLQEVLNYGIGYLTQEELSYKLSELTVPVK